MFFARKVSVFTILSYVFSVGFVFAADTTVTSKQYVDNQLLKKINLETGAGISAGDMLRATVDTNDANKMKWLAWTPDYITNSVLTTRLADYQPKINSISTSGTGNFVTGVTASNGVITATKGDVPDATATTKGIAKMYGSLGSNTDGSMTQKAIRDALKDKVDLVIADDAMALISRDGNGTAVKATSDDVSVANDGSFIVKHATTADSANTAGSVPWAGVTGAPTIPTDISANKVNGAPLSNANTYYYGSGTGANTTVAKAVSIPSITSVPTEGMVIVVKPIATSSAANPTLNLNGTGAVRIKYNNSTTITSTDSGKIWKSGVPSIFVYDGANWVFAGSDTDTKYTFATGGTAGAFSVTPDGTNTQTVYINGWDGKQDTIGDLATIRSGASAGATAVQPDDLAPVATSG
ncbi:MAG: hypothetical protein IJR92_02205, partial [Alphaproteobacteria bacterium]|nr:hypothetical protein [Alphaproteobacteria bacterium]